MGAAERTEVWEKGWQENLEAFRQSGYDQSQLVPKFVRKGNPLRWKQNYIIPRDDEFELNFINIYRHWYAEEYFSKIDKVHEFGCGTGYNLLSLAEKFPKKSYIGSDFVQSAITITNEIGVSRNLNITALKFNMLAPDFSYELARSDGVFTFGALEQLASNLEPMIEFLLKKQPAIIVHTEPVEEYYDLNNLEDYLAYSFQSKRGYSSGLITRLNQLEKLGKIEILKQKRLFFGSFFMEGYNHIAWRPLD